MEIKAQVLGDARQILASCAAGLDPASMQRNKCNFFADIELEYDIPEGSDAVVEVKKCVEFWKDALTK